MSTPFLSVVIPVFNREGYLRETLDSALAQTRPADEIIVIDDGSTDRSAEVARSYGPIVRCVSQPNQGIGGGRNTGISLARGELIALLDSDDLWTANKLERQCAALSERPELDAVFCRMKLLFSPELGPGEVPAGNESVADACLASGLLARRQVFVETGPFDANLRRSEFICWFGRAKENGVRFEVLPEVLLHRRIHAGNSVNDSSSKVECLRVLKRQLDRRRAASARK
jgi:glycosyltransferase involved in cell wall biosynthesis